MVTWTKEHPNHSSQGLRNTKFFFIIISISKEKNAPLAPLSAHVKDIATYLRISSFNVLNKFTAFICIKTEENVLIKT